jgi:serine/threonine protein kinase
MQSYGEPELRNVVTSRPALVGDRYEKGEELGRGAFGQVFKGTDVKNGGFVAIKEISLSGMSHERLKGIMLEIDLLKNLNHENIVSYIGFYKTRTHLDIILEYMEQGALSQLIKKDKWGVLPEQLISAFISQVLTGLKYLHGQGVVHRDIKGANILLGGEVLHPLPIPCPLAAHHMACLQLRLPRSPGHLSSGRLACPACASPINTHALCRAR